MLILKKKLLGYFCNDACIKRDKDSYFSCKRYTKELGKCSPAMNKTVTGDPCRTPCSTGGHTYYWCYTASSWDYCGITLGIIG